MDKGLWVCLLVSRLQTAKKTGRAIIVNINNSK